MSEDSKFPDYITFGRTFEKYKWYKPILVLLVGAIIYIILQGIAMKIFGSIYGVSNTLSVLEGGYESLNTEAGSYISYITIALMTPALYIASRIVRDRPFSSYSSSRGGWNWKLYFKCLSVPLVIFLAYYIIYALINGQIAANTMTLTFFVMCLILVPLQCIAEEYLMRGFLMQTFGSWFKIPIVAVILQAAIFAAMHPYSILGVMEVLISGLLLGFLAWKTNGLEPGSAFHCINNLSIAIFTALGFNKVTTVITPIDSLSGILISLITVMALYYIGTKYDWFSEKTSEN